MKNHVLLENYCFLGGLERQIGFLVDHNNNQRNHWRLVQTRQISA